MIPRGTYVLKSCEEKHSTYFSLFSKPTTSACDETLEGENKHPEPRVEMKMGKSITSARVSRRSFSWISFSLQTLPLILSIFAVSHIHYTFTCHIYMLVTIEMKASNYNVQPLSLNHDTFTTLVIIIRQR